MLWKRVKYILWCLLFINYGHSQFATFNHITTDQGLSSNSVFYLAQDPKGFIWIGTQNGLNRYDGYKMSSDLGSDTTNKLFSNVAVRFIYADSANNLWAYIDHEGLARIDLSTNKVDRYMYDSTTKNSIASNIINEIKEFEKGMIYIATPRGVSILDRNKNTFTTLHHSDKDPNSLLTDNVRTMTKDIYGNYWFGHSGAGITQYIPSQKKFVRHSMSDPKFKFLGNKIRHLFADSKGILWISMWQSGNAFYDIKNDYFWNQEDTTKKYEYLKNVGLVFEFMEDKQGLIWMCTAEKGLAYYNTEKRELTWFENNPDDPQTISDNTNLCMLIDRTGLIWSGTWKGGLNYFNPGCLKFGHIKHESNKSNTLNHNDVISFYEVNHRKVIIGTGNNICYFDPVTKQFTREESKKTDRDRLVEKSQVNFTLRDIDGTFWYCTNGAGAYHYFPETNKFQIYGQSSGKEYFMSDVPEYMLLDKENNLWVGCWLDGLGLYNRDTKTFSFFLTQDKKSPLYSPIIINLTLDDDGMIWIGTKDNGLIWLDPKTKKFEKVDEQKGSFLNFGSVTSVVIDKDNRDKMWITAGGHLLEFDRRSRKFIDHSEVSKELEASFTGCVQDQKGHLWITSTQDLFRFNPATKHYTIYTKADGIQDKTFNSNSILKLSNNKIMIGGINGFNYFDPNDIHNTYNAPSVQFTDLLVLNKPDFITENIAYVKELILSYKDYFFSVQFAALDFADPQKNRFKYKMDGFDNDWIDIGNQHQLTFTNLDPGDYVLNIKAANSHGVWNETPLQLRITITPPFWRTKWFYALCILIIVSSVYGYIRWREKKLRLEKEILEKKVEERTHELNVEKEKVEEAHKDIKDSIYYAQKIQSAIIPSEEDFKKILPNSFVLFQPKDIVSGDFYWIMEKDNYVFCAIADCTGHGVPGGFMTMLGSGLLNETVNEQKLTEPAYILDKLREKIISTLKQTGKSGENKDGMDIVLLRFDRKTRELAYACANNGFLIIENGSMTEHYGDKQPVGIYGHIIKPFSSHKLTLNENAILYSYTDGYPDQFGGEKGKKFKYKTLNTLLVQNSHLQLMYQKDKLHEAFESWRGTHEQIDDVCVVGIKF